MDKRLANKVALVTGSTQGLGYGIVKQLVAAGVSGIGIHGRKQDDADRVTAEIASLGVNALSLAGDIANPDEVARVVEQTVGHFGRLDILVNNAGGAQLPGAPFWQRSTDDFDFQANVNFRSVFLFSKLAALQMIEQGGGRIINISSGGAHLVHSGSAIYDSAKAAVDHFTRCAAVELGPHNVLVNCIAPGSVAKVDDDQIASDPRTRLAPFIIPLGRIGYRHEVGDLVVFLASDEARYITGQVITIDGGRECRLPVVVPVAIDAEGNILEVIPPDEAARRMTNRPS